MIINADAFEYMKNLQDNSIDCIITDPPYELDDISLDEMKRVCKGNIVVFCKPENQFFDADEYHFWVKTPSTKNYSRRCGRFVEMVLVLRRGDTYNQLHWSQMTGVYDDRLVNKPIHPYQKPLTLIERLVRIYTNQYDLVFDPFSGSGTTAHACRNLNRNFVGTEIDTERFLIAEERYNNETT